MQKNESSPKISSWSLLLTFLAGIIIAVSVVVAIMAYPDDLKRPPADSVINEDFHPVAP